MLFALLLAFAPASPPRALPLSLRTSVGICRGPNPPPFTVHTRRLSARPQSRARPPAARGQCTPTACRETPPQPRAGSRARRGAVTSGRHLVRGACSRDSVCWVVGVRRRESPPSPRVRGARGMTIHPGPRRAPVDKNGGGLGSDVSCSPPFNGCCEPELQNTLLRAARLPVVASWATGPTPLERTTGAEVKAA